MTSDGGEALGVSAGSRGASSSGGACQSRTVASALEEARLLPSGEKATARTGPSWPVSVATSCKSDTSQSLTVLSPPAVASLRLLLEKATDSMVEVCPLRL